MKKISFKLSVLLFFSLISIQTYADLVCTSPTSVSCSGPMVVSGNSSGILLSYSSGETITVNGNITIGDGYNQGMNILNSSSNITLNGNIESNGANDVGINVSNTGSANKSTTIMMNGSITNTGGEMQGIRVSNFFSSNNSTTIMMNGNIANTGNYLWGINADISSNNSSTITMNGNITNIRTNGTGTNYGILLSSGGNSSNSVTMNGNITNIGTNAIGINMVSNGTGNTNTVIMNGRISSSLTDPNSYAIQATNYDSTNTNTIQLNKGSSIIGKIDGTLGSTTSGNILKFNLGAGASYNFNAPGFLGDDLNGRPYLADPAAAGIGNVATASQSMYERTTAVSQSLDDRLRTYDLKQNTDQPYWINTYYTDSGRGGEGLTGSNLNFNQYRSGITAGFNLKNSYTPTELVVNYEYGKLNIDDGNQSIQSNSVMAGFLFPDINKVLGGTLSAKAMLGYADNRGNRKVLDNMNANGFENVIASYNSTQFIAGPSWTKTLYQNDKVILDTLLGADLNTQRIDSYTEGSNLFHWNTRTINQIQTRMQLGLKVQPLSIPLHLYGRVGFEYRDLISGDNQKYAITGSSVNYNEPNQQSSYATANVGAYYPITKSINAYTQTKYYTTNKNIDSLTTSVGISGQF